MSLDFDRSPDGEPTTPAAQPPVPTQQAPATTDQEHPAAPSFTPKHAAGEPMDDELTGDEPTVSGSAIAEPAAVEPEADELADDEPVASGSALSDEPAAEPASRPTADEPTASGRVASGSVTGDHEPAELADDEPAAAGSAASEYVLAEPEPESEPAADEPAAAEPVPADATASGATAYHASAALAWDAQTADGASTGHKAGIEPVADLDGPLLSDADELRTSWPRIQAAFVDDPREAVADAAGLVEHAAQALTSALRQRQRQLRAVWDRDGMPDGTQYADSGGTAPGAAAPDEDRQAADGPDTEQLRLLIQRYRRLFDQLSR
ncbi:MAG: hypothetical protein WBE95_27225 [Trebonia sp.]|uniref:hypothetical protein n=1 Tax=Trebonia sp. TaxID=2767075 RepID=UPI003C763AE3